MTVFSWTAPDSIDIIRNRLHSWGTTAADRGQQQKPV